MAQGEGHGPAASLKSYVYRTEAAADYVRCPVTLKVRERMEFGDTILIYAAPKPP